VGASDCVPEELFQVSFRLTLRERLAFWCVTRMPSASAMMSWQVSGESVRDVIRELHTSLAAEMAASF
jgi:hypothetical protein